MESIHKVGITEVVLRDGHQSLLATRMRIDDMLPICAALDDIGFWSIESWGGATFDACIRFLGEDPWDRIRALKEAMPKTPQQMLLRGQNLLGYRHYADDVVDAFVERAAINGIDIFRVFDALNDPRNMERAIAAVRAVGKHAQGTLSYTTSPVHTLESWWALATRIADMGADSICIKDMAGILTPYTAFELVQGLKKRLTVPVHLHCHATPGLSSMTLLKAIEAGIDNVDTAISSMSLTYGHTPTESIVATLANTERDSGIDLAALAPIADHFRTVRKKYAAFEGTLKGIDARILTAHVPGGMLTNMENQLREQQALDQFDAVLAEIPCVRKDLGYIPLVTPTSQIVGTQAVLNVLGKKRYATISKETADILKGEYGTVPAAMDTELQQRVLHDSAPITCRPADLIADEMDTLRAALKARAQESDITLQTGAWETDDVLTYALFPQVGLRFLTNRGNPDRFEPHPNTEQSGVPDTARTTGETTTGRYTVTVAGEQFSVVVAHGDAAATPIAHADDTDLAITAPLGGTILQVACTQGQHVNEGDVLIVLEAMKMETEIKAPQAGTVGMIAVKESDSIASGALLLHLR